MANLSRVNPSTTNVFLEASILAFRLVVTVLNSTVTSFPAPTSDFRKWNAALFTEKESLPLRAPLLCCLTNNVQLITKCSFVKLDFNF